MDLQAIKTYLGPHWTAWQEVLATALAGRSDRLNAINTFIQEQPGKQIRPLLALLTATGIATPTVLTYFNAAVTEILHNASLLHDDVADEATQRRGRPSVPQRFGTDSSILAGDIYVASAMDLLFAHGHADYAWAYIRMMRRMCEGELFQIDKSHTPDYSLEDYDYIIHCKTAYVFETSMRMSARSVGGTSLQEEAAARMGGAIGRAFQIRDDIFDLMPQYHTGKPFGLDLYEGKRTLPLLLAQQEASPAEREALALHLQNLRGNKSPQAGDSAPVLDFIARHRGIEKAQAILDKHCQNALDQSQELPASTSRDYLCEIIRYLRTRTK